MIKKVCDRKLIVRLIEKTETNIESIFNIENETFGKNSNNLSLNIWSLQTFIRYGKVFGIFTEDSMEGFIIYVRSWINPNFAYLAKIAIKCESQGKGYGSYLLNESLLNLKKDGISFIGLTVDPANSRNLHIYREKFGFEVVEYRNEEYGPGYDRLFMRLDMANRTKESSFHDVP